MGDKRLVRVVAVALLVATLIGVVPQSHARAFAPPIPVAPPVTGLCTTPVGVVACLVVAGGIGVIVGLGGEEATVGQARLDDGSWCMVDAHIFPSDSSTCGPRPRFRPHDATTQALLEALARLYEEGELEPFDPLGSFWLPDPSYLDFGDTPGIIDDGDIKVRILGVAHHGGPVGGHQEGLNPFVITAWYEVMEGGLPECAPHSDTIFNDTSSMPYNRAGSSWVGERGFGHNSEWYQAQEECVVVTPYRWTTHYPHAPGNGDHWTVVPRVPDRYECPKNPQSRYFGMEFGGGKSSYFQGCLVAPPREDYLPERGATMYGYVHVHVAGRTGGAWMRLIRTNSFAYMASVLECRAASGEVRQVLSSGPGAPPGAEAELPESGCAPGEVPQHETLYYCPANGDLQDCVKVAETDLNFDEPEVQLDCLHRLASGMEPCPMWVEFFDGSTWVKCEQGVTCADWWTDPGRDVMFRCGWGGDYYNSSQCVALKDWYKSGGEVIPQNPSKPEPDPISVGDPVQIGGPVPPTTAQPTRTWYGRIIYEWWGGGPMPLMSSCWPQGWGLLNPLQWVLRPTMCALAWAFVPQTPLEVRLETMMEALKAKTGLDLEAVATFPLPSVGSACGWGFAAWEGNYLGEVPAVNIIPCPSDLGPAGVSAAATSRLLSHGILGMWTFGLLHRWFSLRNDPLIAAGDEGGSVV